MAWLLTEGAHWGLALVPVLVLLALFVWLDAFKLMSLGEVLLLLVLGGMAALAAYPISGRMIDTLPIGFNFYSRFIAPWIEEALKAIVVVALFRMNRVGYKLDAVVSGFAIGAGFSVVENILYLTFFPDYGVGTWLVRGLGTAVMHGTTLALLAAIAHEFAERENREAASEFRLQPAVVCPRLSGRGRDPHRLQPISRPAAGGDDGRGDLCPDCDHRDLPLRHCRGAELARRRIYRSIASSWRHSSPAHGRRDRAVPGYPRLPAASIPKARSASAATGSSRRGW